LTKAEVQDAAAKFLWPTNGAERLGVRQRLWRFWRKANQKADELMLRTVAGENPQKLWGCRLEK
jgi:hypothetical protein